jgi:hypothetical protein
MNSPHVLILALILTILTSVTLNRAQGQSATSAPAKKDTPSSFNDYVGRYELASNEIPITTIDVTFTKQGLWAKPSLAVKRKLVAQSKMEFLDELENTRYTFTRDPSKKVTSLTFEYQGKSYTARKLEVGAPSLTGNVTFQLLRYPDANIVALAGSFNNWNQSQTLCAKERDRWLCRMKLEPGKYLYKFIVDGDWITDPDNPNTEDDGNGNINSVLVVVKL